MKFFHATCDFAINSVTFLCNKMLLSSQVKEYFFKNINVYIERNFAKVLSAIRVLFICWKKFECLIYQNKDISSRVRWITSLRRRVAVVRTFREYKSAYP